MIKHTTWTIKTFPRGETTIFGGAMAISGSVTPNTYRWQNGIPAEFNHSSVFSVTYIFVHLKL